MSMCVFVFLSIHVSKRGGEKYGQSEVGERCFRGWGRWYSPWVCASLSTLYPLFIESKPG